MHTFSFQINLGKVYEIKKINILRGVSFTRPQFLTLEYGMDGRNFLTQRVGLHFYTILILLTSMVSVKSVVLYLNNDSKSEIINTPFIYFL